MSEDLDHQMDGKIAVITGGTQGLGEAVAWLFAKRGAAGLVTCGRNAANGKRVAESISKDGCATQFVEADLGRVEDCARVIAAADARFGRIDSLVNCAATTMQHPRTDDAVAIPTSAYSVMYLLYIYRICSR